MEEAPLLTDLDGVPAGGAGHWLRTADGVRVRIGCWRPENARGTLILCPGRSEYIEKYGETAADLTARGYAVMVIDWRGQGLSDRLLEDRRIGHVTRYTDYQHDLMAACEAGTQLDLPRPWHILGHSMAGPIVLRALMENRIDVASVVFTGPMFGISMSPALRPLGWALALAGPAVGLGSRLPPSTRVDNYVLTNPFEGNVLTRDPDQYRRMQDHLTAHPELALGGPSLIWLREALSESYRLSKRPSPDLPALCLLGTAEKINDTQRIRDRMAAWPKGELMLLEDTEHEVLIEVPKTRRRALEAMTALFERTGGHHSPARSA